MRLYVCAWCSVCVCVCFSILKTSVLGQSDIKKLRRENYQLRREIWTLRDEYDRLGKLLKNKCDPFENANSTCSYDCGRSASDCKRGSDYGDGCRCYSCCIDDVSVALIGTVLATFTCEVFKYKFCYTSFLGQRFL